jgi:nucleotide-binding universal stress UspA family protein
MNPNPRASLPKMVLVAVEGSEPSLRESSMKAAAYATNIAAASAAELYAICVVQIPEYIEERTRDVLRAELTKKSEEALREVEQHASAAGVKASSRVLVTGGAISSAICDFGSKNRVDLIVLGTRASTSSLSKMMLGSVASGVASNADCPVLVVR